MYVCDATGTMLGLKMELLKQQVAKAIDALPPDAQFNVIFFRSGEDDDDAPMFQTLEVASPANKRRALARINDTSVRGAGTNPIPAMRQALSGKPERVVLLTDGEFNRDAKYPEVRRSVRGWNVGKASRIDTILLMSDDAQAEAVLREIAKDSGGQFRKVLESDMKK